MDNATAFIAGVVFGAIGIAFVFRCAGGPFASRRR